MTPNILALYATVIVLFVMAYFALASFAFVFVRLEVDAVARMLRGLFSICYLMLAGAGALAALAYIKLGVPGFAVAMAGIALLALLMRRGFLKRVDAGAVARAAGDRVALRQYRLLHLGGMVVNFVQLVAVASSISLIPG